MIKSPIKLVDQKSLYISAFNINGNDITVIHLIVINMLLSVWNHYIL